MNINEGDLITITVDLVMGLLHPLLNERNNELHISRKSVSVENDRLKS